MEILFSIIIMFTIGFGGMFLLIRMTLKDRKRTKIAEKLGKTYISFAHPIPYFTNDAEGRKEAEKYMFWYEFKD